MPFCCNVHMGFSDGPLAHITVRMRITIVIIPRRGQPKLYLKHLRESCSDISYRFKSLPPLLHGPAMWSISPSNLNRGDGATARPRLLYHLNQLLCPCSITVLPRTRRSNVAAVAAFQSCPNDPAPSIHHNLSTMTFGSASLKRAVPPDESSTTKRLSEEKYYDDDAFDVTEFGQGQCNADL